MDISRSPGSRVPLIILCLALCLGITSCRSAAHRAMAQDTVQPGPVAAPVEPASPDLPLQKIASNKNLAWPLEDVRLVVDKKARTISVFSGETFLKSYPVAFGDNARGPKTREGDQRTPEGEYYVLKYTSPSFGRCFYIAYPNLRDAQRALDGGRISQSRFKQIKKSLEKKQKPPHDTGLGGLILLHGTRDRSQNGLTATDWTLGCIAMENAHILELLDAVPDSARPRMTITPWPPD